MKSAYILNNFLESDQLQANRELNCYNDCSLKAAEHVLKNEFHLAAIQHENITRSLNALERMKNNKLEVDQTSFILGQIKARKDNVELLNRLRKTI